MDASQIPGIEIRILSRRFKTFAEAFFEDLNHKKEFEEWKKKREAA